MTSQEFKRSNINKIINSIKPKTYPQTVTGDCTG